MHIVIFLAFLMVGALSGTLAGLLGIGGGIIVVPCLVFVLHHFHQVPEQYVAQVAAASSLAAMVVTSARSVYLRSRKGLVDVALLKTLLPGVILGVILGAILASHLHSRLLEIILGVVLVGIALLVLNNARLNLKVLKPNKIRDGVVTLLIGLKSGLLGLGGGAIMIPYLLFCGVPMQKASSSAAACSLPIALSGALSYAVLGRHLVIPLAHSSGFIYWPAVIGVAGAGVISVSLGVHLSMKLNVVLLKRIFALFLLLSAVYMLFH